MTGGIAHEPIMRPGRATFAARNSSSITTCSTAFAPRPHGGGHVGTRYPASAMRARCAVGIEPVDGRQELAHPTRAARRLPIRGRSPASGGFRRARAHAARCRAATDGPSRLCIDIARFKYMCASCSQVNPIPAEHLDAVLRVRERGVDRERDRDGRHEREPLPALVARPALGPRRVDHAAASARELDSRLTMSAHLCFTPWNCPIGRPNWTRTLAYSAAVVTHHCATPTSSAAASTPARSRASAGRRAR